MNARFYVAQVYLHVLAFALLCVGLVSLCGYAATRKPGLYDMVLLPEVAVASALTGGLLLGVLYGRRYLLSVLSVLLMGVTLYPGYELLGEHAEIARFLPEELVLRAHIPLLLSFLAAGIALLLCLGPTTARWLARFGGAVLIFAALLAPLFADTQGRLGFSYGVAVSSFPVARLFILLLGLAVLLLSVAPAAKAVKTAPLTMLAGISGTLLTCIAWYLLSQHLFETVTRQSELLLSDVQRATERTLRDQLALLGRMAKRWETLGVTPSGELWSQEAGSYLRDVSNLHLIAVLDERMQPVLLESIGPTDVEWLQTVLAKPEFRGWLEHTQQDAQPHLSQAVSLDSADQELLVASRLRIDGQPPRYLVASLNVRDTIREVVGEGVEGLGVSIYQGDTLIYSPDLPRMNHVRFPLGARDIRLHHDQHWRVESFIIDVADLSASPHLAVLIMGFGLALSFLLMLSQQLAGAAADTARQLHGTNYRLKTSLAARASAQALNQRIMQFTMDVLCSFDNEGRFREVSPSCFKLFGYRPDELIGKPYLDLVLEEDRESTVLEALALKDGRATYGFRNRYRHKDGRILHILWSADWSEGEQTLFAVAHDITTVVQNEAFADNQREILGMISMDCPKTEILEAVCRMVEAQMTGALCSVLLLDGNGDRLYTAAAPSLPDAFRSAIDGPAVNPDSDSCAAALHERTPIVVEDLECDALWSDRRHLARPFGLRACWSFPLISLHGQAFGVLVVYFKMPLAPSDEQTDQLATASRLAAIAVARSRDRRRLRESEQRFRSLFTFNPDAVFSFDLEGAFQDLNSVGVGLIGLPEEKILGHHFGKWIYEEDLPRVREYFSAACQGVPQRYEVRLLDGAGQLLHLDVCNLPIMVDSDIVGVFGIAKDVTQRERMTAELKQALLRSERQAEQLRRLGHAAIATAQLHDQQQLIDYLAEQVRLTIGAHQALISLADGTQWCQVLTSVSFSDEYAHSQNLDEAATAQDICGVICETNEPMLLTRQSPQCHSGKHVDPQAAHGLLAVPLIAKDGSNLGLMQLSNKYQDDFLPDDLAIAQQFAQMVVSIVENGRLLNEVLAAEQGLKTQLAFTSTITQCMAEGLLAISGEGRLSFMNPAAQRWLAADGSEAIGQPIEHYLPLRLADFSAAQQGKEQGELRIGERVLRYEARPLVGETDSGGWVLALHDVSALLRADQAMRERDQFFNLSLEMFCMVSLGGRFIQVNPSFAETLRYSSVDLIGSPYMALIDEADREIVEQAVTLLQQGERIHNLIIRVWDGEDQLHWLQISAALGADQVIYCVARDITESRAIQHQLAQSNLILSLAGQTAKLGGWSLELPGHELVWSPEMFALLGFASDATPDLEESLALYPYEHRAKIVQALEACRSRGEPFDLDLQVLDAQKALLDVRLTGQAVRGEGGDIERICGALQDISERKQAQRELLRLAQRLGSTLESITDAFITYDQQWRFNYINREAATLLGASKDELIGQTLWSVYPDLRESDIGRRYLQAVQHGQAAHFDTYYAPLASWFEIHAYPFEEGLAVYFRNISARKRTEQDLERSLRELERSNRELQEFAFVASHDLQEPLRKIQAFSERLQTRVDQLDEEGRDYLRRLVSAASRMQALIVDLLNYSRVNTRGQPLEAVALNGVLDDVLIDLESSIEQADACIEREPLPHVMGDVSQLRQVFQNLLSNALKFRDPLQTPRIRIYSEPSASKGLTVCVADNGIGFDEKYLPKIFNPFQRLHGREAYAGTGIGLAIVKKIVERHGASISATSAPGKGCVFRVTFPLGDTELHER
ncbi:PAS domain S-box protein [Pseudomonas stutzeri]|uniref:PAS domain S-box protein n=1 Tax=Stutzerimonas stutzeri TaxID=316 RepID=UPI001EB9E3D3|nr:PAS domain S-box protein [Stutzerimonas stutzeri]MBK3867397.1 PAS domain S-box protein [Stutzerimonas stutzeri]